MKSTRLSLKSATASTPLWSALLCAADGDEDGKGADDKSKSGGADKDDENKDDADRDKNDPAQKKIRGLEEEKNRHFEGRKTAEQERDDALKRLKEFEDKDKDEITKATEKVTELTSTVESLQKTNERLALENAFLRDNTFTWQKPDAALRLADLSSVKISDDGKVTGLKEALEALAESDPYLLVAKKDDDGDDKKPEPKKSGDGPKTDPKKNEGAAAERKRLQDKYPALRRR